MGRLFFYLFYEVKFWGIIKKIDYSYNFLIQGIKITYKKPKKLALANLDWEKISEVATNLIDNAIKYTPKNGKVFVRLQNLDIKTANPKVKFSISDNGIGISQDEMRNLFKKFSRSENSSVINTEGTGLGLYVAKKIIKDHGGNIWAKSEGRGKGSEFCFKLPIGKNVKYLIKS